MRAVLKVASVFWMRCSDTAESGENEYEEDDNEDYREIVVWRCSMLSNVSVRRLGAECG